MTDRTSRRTLIRGIGAAATVGVLAGCSTDTQGDGGDGGDGGSDGGGSDGGGSDTSVPSAVDDYLSGAQNYDGEAADETGTDSPTVNVGAGNGLAFGPAAVRVSSGTTVTWEWTGEGGGHNVVHQDGEFSSGDEFVSEEGHTYEYTFEESGNYLYYCEPHQASGMKGAVIVE